MLEDHPFKLSMNSEGYDDDDDDYSISPFSDHREFIDMVREAEREAMVNGEKSYYSWRGYRGYVGPQMPRITLPGLKMRLMNALQRVNDPSDPEKMVFN